MKARPTIAELRAQVDSLEERIASTKNAIERGWGQMWANELGDKQREIELSRRAIARARKMLEALELAAAADDALERGGGESWPTGGGAL